MAEALIEAISRSEAATLLRVTETSVRRYERAGRLPKAVIRASTAGFKRGYYPKPEVERLQKELDIEKFDGRSEVAQDREFNASLESETVRDELFRREDLSIDFHAAEQNRKREAEEKEAAAKRAVELVIVDIEEKYEQKVWVLERENNKLERELREAKNGLEAI